MFFKLIVMTISASLIMGTTYGEELNPNKSKVLGQHSVISNKSSESKDYKISSINIDLDKVTITLGNNYVMAYKCREVTQRIGYDLSLVCENFADGTTELTPIYLYNIKHSRPDEAQVEFGMLENEQEVGSLSAFKDANEIIKNEKKIEFITLITK